MKRIGEIIKNARTEKRYTYIRLEEITKIKADFLEAIENEKWSSLPSFTTVLGFIKTLASVLDIDEKMAVAVLKRDYPPKNISINPKPDVSSKPTWNPKFTFIIGVGVVLLAVLGYLGFQYKKFVSPPEVVVLSPVNGQMVQGNSVLVFGSTDSDVKIIADNQPILVNEDGKFSANIEVADGAEEITIIAQSRSGKTTTVSRKINVSN